MDNTNKILARASKQASKLPALLINAEKIAMSVMQGVHGRRRAGTGDSFWQFREYDASDSVKDIDWRKSAMSEKVFVKQKEWDSVQTVYVWRNSGSSMDYSYLKKNETKQYYADLILTSLSMILIEGGEQISLIGSGKKLFRTKNSMPEVVELMLSSDLELVEKSRISNDANVILIGDFLNDLSGLEIFIDRLLHKNIGINLVQVLDRSELELPFSGNVDFRGMTGDDLLQIPDVGSIKDKYQDKINEHNLKLENIVKSKSGSFLRFVTDEDLNLMMQKLYFDIGGDV